MRAIDRARARTAQFDILGILSWETSCRTRPQALKPTPPGSDRRVFCLSSRTGMTISVVPEICPAARIKRPKPLHAVRDRVSGRRTVCNRRWSVIARTIIARSVGGCQRATDDCAPDNSSGNRRAPSPTSASVLHGLDNTRASFGDPKRLANGSRTGGAREHRDAAGEQG